MFDFSPIQIIIVLVIALLVFGPKRLPELARSVGRGVREFRGAVAGDAASAPAAPAPSAATTVTPAVGAVAEVTPEDLDGIVATDAPPPPARSTESA